MLVGPILCKPCTDNYSYNNFMSSTAMFCPDVFFLLHILPFVRHSLSVRKHSRLLCTILFFFFNLCWLHMPLPAPAPTQPPLPLPQILLHFIWNNVFAFVLQTPNQYQFQTWTLPLESQYKYWLFSTL